MTYENCRYVIGEVLVLIAHSHVVDGKDLKGQELISDFVQGIDYGTISLRYNGGIIKVPVEKCMFWSGDLRYDSQYDIDPKE